MRRRLLTYTNNIQTQDGISIEDTVAGDVVFYNPSLDELIVRRDQSDWKLDEEPIGVVVIPASHNVYGNGACGVMNLYAASTLTPDVGQVSNIGMYYGQYGTDISELYNYTSAVYIKGGNNSGTPQGTKFQVYLPSDKFSALKCPSDPIAYYGWDDTDPCAPSPYLTDGSRNSAYYQTTAPSSTNNVLSDFKGKENTAILISKATAQSDWKTAPSIINEYGSGYSPAACTSWRYYTKGTKQGDWYLPAMGELGYICVRYKKINDTISALQSHFDKKFCLLDEDYIYWSSSESSSDSAWYLNFYSGAIYYETYKKSGNGCVRPFMQLGVDETPGIIKTGIYGLMSDGTEVDYDKISPECVGIVCRDTEHDIEFIVGTDWRDCSWGSYEYERGKDEYIDVPVSELPYRQYSDKFDIGNESTIYEWYNSGYTGVKNTDTIVSYAATTGREYGIRDCAAIACSERSLSLGDKTLKGYLGCAAEMLFIRDNIITFKNALDKIGNRVFKLGYYDDTTLLMSELYDSTTCWSLSGINYSFNFDSATKNRYISMYALPFFKLDRTVE